MFFFAEGQHEQAMLAVYFSLLTFWGRQEWVIKFTNWMYLFLFTANLYVSQNTQMMQLTDGHFVLHKPDKHSNLVTLTSIVLCAVYCASVLNLLLLVVVFWRGISSRLRVENSRLRKKLWSNSEAGNQLRANLCSQVICI